MSIFFHLQLIKIERVSETQWTEESVLSVAFATMLPASPEDQLVNLRKSAQPKCGSNDNIAERVRIIGCLIDFGTNTFVRLLLLKPCAVFNNSLMGRNE